MKNKSSPMIGPKQISDLARRCRRLIGASPAYERLANPFLLVRNGHPNTLLLYKSYFGKLAARRDFLKNFVKAFAQVGLSLVRREPLAYHGKLPTNVDVLFVSHFVNVGQLNSDRDVYLGDVPNQLLDAGYSSFTARINHTWTGKRVLQSHFTTNGKSGAILSRTIAVGRELKNFLRLFAERRVLKDMTAAGDDSVVDHAAAHSVSTGSMSALRIAQQVEDLIHKLQPKMVIATYEGHSWERLVFASARAVCPNVKCIGYHHTILFPEQNALAIRISDRTDPDVVLTAGDVSRNWFSAQEELSSVPAFALGSPRRPTGRIAKVPSKALPCLVTPEGLLDESVDLFRLALETAKALPQQQFVLRLHPVINRKNVEEALGSLKSLPGNVMWSQSGLQDDIAQCGFLLYRGSTVVIEAIMSGLRPIYFEKSDDSFTIDPLSKLTKWREKVSSSADLAAVFNNFLAF